MLTVDSSNGSPRPAHFFFSVPTTFPIQTCKCKIQNHCNKENKKEKNKPKQKPFFVGRSYNLQDVEIHFPGAGELESSLRFLLKQVHLSYCHIGLLFDSNTCTGDASMTVSAPVILTRSTGLCLPLYKMHCNSSSSVCVTRHVCLEYSGKKDFSLSLVASR